MLFSAIILSFRENIVHILPSHKAQSSVDKVKCRNILEVLKDSLEDRPQKNGRDMAEAEVRYKLIIDPSEDDSLMRLLFSFGVLKREETRMFVCSDFPGDSQLQKVIKHVGVLSVH